MARASSCVAWQPAWPPIDELSVGCRCDTFPVTGTHLGWAHSCPPTASLSFGDCRMIQVDMLGNDLQLVPVARTETSKRAEEPKNFFRFAGISRKDDRTLTHRRARARRQGTDRLRVAQARLDPPASPRSGARLQWPVFNRTGKTCGRYRVPGNRVTPSGQTPKHSSGFTRRFKDLGGTVSGGSYREFPIALVVFACISAASLPS
jgi:hypothetical protein